MLDELFARHGLPSLDKQSVFADVVEGRPWQVSYPAGILSFAPELEFEIQILGSLSDIDGTWLWAWANSSLVGCPTAASESLREYGEENVISEFTTPEFGLGPDDAHVLSMIAIGVLKADCYFRCPYDGGAAFVAVPFAPELRAMADLSAHHVANRIMDFVCQYPTDGRLAIEHYLTYKSYTFDYRGTTLLASGPALQAVEVRFNPDWLVSEVRTVVTAPIHPADA